MLRNTDPRMKKTVRKKRFVVNLKKELKEADDEEADWDKPFVLSKSNERSSGLMSSLKFLLDEGFATDFEIRTSKVSLPVHRVVLAASSNYFKAMLLHNMKESNQGYVEIKELDCDAVEACVSYLYTGEIRFNDFDEIEPALKTSDFLQIIDLKDFLLELLRNKMNSRTCLRIRAYAVTYCSDAIVKACDDFIANHLLKVAKSDQWLLLNFEEVYQYVGLSTCKRSAILWEVISKWVMHDQSSREEHICEYIKLIDPIDLIVLTQILTHPLIAENAECIRYIWANTVQPNIPEVQGLINSDNCFLLYSLAKRFEQEQLLKAAGRFMIDNVRAASISRRLNELDRDDVTFLLTKFDCYIREESKFRTIAAWARGNDSHKRDFVDLFRSINLSEVSIDFIETIIRKDETVSSSVECSNVIMDDLCQRVRCFEEG